MEGREDRCGENSFLMYKNEPYEFANICPTERQKRNTAVIWHWNSQGLQAFKTNTSPSQNSVGALEHPYHCWEVSHPKCLGGF